MSDKVTTAERNMNALKAEVAHLKKQMTQIQQTAGSLENHVEDAEGRSRRNNVRILGFLERAEGQAPEKFIEDWICMELKPPGLSNLFVVERAHRALVPPPLAGAPPRAIIARVLNYRD